MPAFRANEPQESEKHAEQQEEFAEVGGGSPDANQISERHGF